MPAGEQGEITLAGGVMMDGYYGDRRRPPWCCATAGSRPATWAGWTRLAGSIYTGRLKDMIRRSGENVAAGEVEEVLLTHQGIRLAAVTGVPDELRGEEVKAYYVAGTEPSQPSWRPIAPSGWRRSRCRATGSRADLPRTDSERVAKQRLGELAGPVFDLRTGAWNTVAGG